MDRFKFWKRDVPIPPAPPVTPSVSRFNVTPRTDVGNHGLPSDPVLASRLSKLRRRREALAQEVSTALDAGSEQNRWRAEIALIEQAIDELNADIDALPTSGGPAGFQLPPEPIVVRWFRSDPVVEIELAIGSRGFTLAEELDWAERGFQLARSDLSIVSGDVSELVPIDSSPADRTALAQHLARSLIIYATDAREQLLNELPIPAATLADLARPSSEFGAWLDWHGNSLFAQSVQLQKRDLLADRDRLEAERSALVEEESKTAENLPFAQRRLAEVDREIIEITKQPGS